MTPERGHSDAASRDGATGARPKRASSRGAHHREVAGRFGELVEATTDWSAPSPVDGWTARDVVGHLVEWLPPFLEGGAGVERWLAPSVAEDPIGAWRAQYAAVQALLDDPATTDRTFSNPHTGDLPLDRAIDQFYTSDVFLHAWDLAAATGQPHRLEENEAEAMLAGMAPYEEMMRGSGQYGAPVAVPADASAHDRLLGFIGRDPAWQAG